MVEFPLRIYNAIKHPLISWCGIFKITPNQITIINQVLMMTAGLYFFSRGTNAGYVAALCVSGITVILDYLDGDLAKTTGKMSSLGMWLDSGFDIILQNFVMGAIGIGCVKSGMAPVWIVLFMASNSGKIVSGMEFNNKLGFDSSKGNAVFRKYMDAKPSVWNRVIKNLIDPTDNPIGLVIFTLRYWIVFGALTGQMVLCFKIMAIMTMVQASGMFFSYAGYRAGFTKLWIFQALSLIDDSKQDFYTCRMNTKS